MQSLLSGFGIVAFMMWLIDLFFAPGLLAGIWTLIVSLF